MDFSYSDEQQAIKDTFARFVREQVTPRARPLDEAGEFPRELFTAVGELGFFGMRYPQSVGGSDAGTVAYILAVEELARGSLALAAACTMQSLMGTYFVKTLGSPALHERLLGPALRGDKIGTICMTEPDAGSDLGAIATRARPDGHSGFLLNGSKIWITSAPVADFFTVFAKVGEGDQEGLGIFLVERDNPGLQVGRRIDKMGVKASVTSEVFFEDCHVSPEAVLEGQGRGMAHLREILNEIRIMTAALSLGVGQAALDDAVAYAKERRQFGRPIIKFQAMQARVADMATELEAARRLTQYAAWRAEQGLPRTKEASMAKYFASEAAYRACEHGSRMMGAYGYADDFPMQRYFRDVRFTLIGGGTAEMMQLTIAREVAR
jgi:butyryl-CoA dehydrogenase